MATKRGTAGRRIKEIAREDGILSCWVCGWECPPRLMRYGGIQTPVAAHHVIPVSCGGDDELHNLILLCPNHHAIAHRLGMIVRVAGRKRWSGPQDTFELRDALIAIDQDPDKYFRDRQLALADRLDARRDGP